MSRQVTPMDLRSAEYTGFLSNQIDPASKMQAANRAAPLPKVRTIALNRGNMPHLVNGNRKIKN